LVKYLNTVNPYTPLSNQYIHGAILTLIVLFSLLQGEWGMTEADEEEVRKRSVNFVDNIVPNARAQLRVLFQSYQVIL